MSNILPLAIAVTGIGILLLPVAGLAVFLAGVALGLMGFLTGTLFPED